MRKNEKGEWMVEHHTHYKEIDGYDETVWMTYARHHELHVRLRKEGKCNISVEKLTEISNKAQHRTEKWRKYQAEWRKNNKNYMKEYYRINKETIKNRSKNNRKDKEKMKEYQKEWRENNKEKKREYARKYREKKRGGD